MTWLRRASAAAAARAAGVVGGSGAAAPSWVASAVIFLCFLLAISTLRDFSSDCS